MNGWCRKNPKGPSRKEDGYQSTKEIDENKKRVGRNGICRLGKKFQLAPTPVVRRCADDGNDDVKRNLETG